MYPSAAALIPMTMRASFIMWNICASPAPSSPTRYPTALGLPPGANVPSPRLSKALVVPRLPILWLSPASTTSFRAVAPAAVRYFGTMNKEIPLTPAALPGVVASARWTTFSDSSWSPPVIHILVPVTRYVPSSCRTARVVMSARDEPDSGSDRHMVPKYRPPSIGRTQLSTCCGVPYRASR